MNYRRQVWSLQKENTLNGIQLNTGAEIWVLDKTLSHIQSEVGSPVTYYYEYQIQINNVTKNINEIVQSDIVYMDIEKKELDAFLYKNCILEI